MLILRAKQTKSPLTSDPARAAAAPEDVVMAHERLVESRASGWEPGAAGAALLQPKDYAELLSIGRALASTVEHAAVAATLVEEVRRVSGAARVAVWEIARDGELRLVAESTCGTPRRCGTVMVHRSSPEWDVMRAQEPVWLPTRGEAEKSYAATRLDPRGASRCEAWALLPAMVDGEAGRVLALAFAQPRPFDEHDRAVLGEIASASGNALARGRLFTHERARAEAAETARAALDERFRGAERLVSERTHLYERERFASGRLESELSSTRDAADGLERAQALLAALAAAADGREISHILAARAPGAFGAFGLAVTRRAGAAELEVVRSVGFPDDIASVGSRVHIDSSPEGDVVRSGAPLWIDSREEMLRRHRAAADLLRLGSGVWLGVPVSSGADVLGTLSLTFRCARTFSVSERDRVILLAGQCAAALARAGALEAERTAQ
ncbi:MAG TPA: GAF domain-containing protein [Anaeromyxobacteraceae bacterium]|nr:GAF domain-containing protein [Anaeromyxobacteraceae bacterium]